MFLGIVFCLIAFFTSYFLFKNIPNLIGISTIMLTVIISLPSVNKLLEVEEKVEEKGKKSFFKEHEAIFDFYIYFFIGVFIVLFVVAGLTPKFVFSEQQMYGIKEIQPALEEGIPPPPGFGNEYKVVSLFEHNFYVMAICFLLSLFYGSGALFLIILNASIFASALANAIRVYAPSTLNFVTTYSFMGCNVGIMFFHMIPEVAGYLLAAIAGGVLSKAMLKHKYMSKKFKRVVKDSVILLIVAIIILLLAAFIEVHVSEQLFTENVCVNSVASMIGYTLFAIIFIIVLEIIRKRKKVRKK